MCIYSGFTAPKINILKVLHLENKVTKELVRQL